MRKTATAAMAVLAALATWAALGQGTGTEHEAIRYGSSPANDPVTRLEKGLQSGAVKLRFDETFGYLPALLEALEVPRESQMLVFSKTSFQAVRIQPSTPRSIYFNDHVSIGFVQGGDVLEVAAQDPRQGTIFYTLDQDRGANPSLVRRDDACLQCHLGGATSQVPGLMIRSVYPEPTGMPLFQAGSFLSDHRSPLSERWGGWFVTGSHGRQIHMGNSFVRNRETPNELDRTDSMNRRDLPGIVRPDAVLTPHSDIVALLVAEHQFRGLNLITRLNWETRMAVHQRDLMGKLLGEVSAESAAACRRRIGNASEELAKYLTFSDETVLTEPVTGTSRFREVFEARGPLRALDLKTRLFRHRLSYLALSEEVAALPPEAQQALEARLYERLSQWPPGEREEVLALLRKQKNRLPPALVALADRW